VNNTPEGHGPCVVRNVEDLIDGQGNELVFSPFEREEEFRGKVSDCYKEAIKNNSAFLMGRNISFV